MSSSTPDGSTAHCYYCHICRRDIENLDEDYCCPVCHGGFVEVVEGVPISSNDFAAPNPLLRNYSLGSTAASSSAPVPGRPINLGNFSIQILPLSSQNQSNSDGSGQVAISGNANDGGQVGQQQPDSFQDYFRGFIETVVQGITGANVHIQPGVATFTIPHGNFGDYAWGPGGLDAIVTQLLNQVEGGAPPMSNDKIDSLPETIITQEHVDKRLQCAVCMEDFKLNETVCRVACEHLFHKDCIKPWLARHNSCPICRKSAETGQAPSEQQQNQATSTVFTTQTMPTSVDSNAASQPLFGANFFFGPGGSNLGRQFFNQNQQHLPPNRSQRPQSQQPQQPQTQPQSPPSTDDNRSQWMDIDELD